jgi:hypothetical protein
MHPDNVIRRTKVLHREFQQHFPSMFSKLSNMLTGE